MQSTGLETMNITAWIVPKDFTGTTNTHCYLNADGVEMAAYTNMDVQSYLTANQDLQRITDDQHYALVTAFEDTCKVATRVTLERWDDLLGVLPPAKWGHFGGAELFHVIERLRGDLVAWYVKFDDKNCFEVIETSTAARETVIAKARAVQS
jgi:hypothetical protein